MGGLQLLDKIGRSLVLIILYTGLKSSTWKLEKNFEKRIRRVSTLNSNTVQGLLRWV